MLYTGTPHIFGLATAVIACVSIQMSAKNTDWTLHTQTRHYTHLLFCEVTHHRQERFVLFDRCRRSSLCVLTKDSQCPSCFAKRTSRSSSASYKTEYSVSVMRPVVLPENRCFTMTSAVMELDTLEVDQIMSRYVLVFEYSFSRSPCPPDPCSQNLTPGPVCLCISPKEQ